MKNILLLTDNQADFLKENRQDPITGDRFKLGNEIVFCAECKSAFLKESWDYMGSQHCNQSETLTQIPKSRNLKIRKSLKFNSKTPALRELFFTWVIDTFIWLIVNFIFWHLSKGYLESSFLVYNKLFAIFTLLLKDNNLIVTSVGKVARGISIVYIKDYKKMNPVLLPLRHIMPVFSLSLALLSQDIKAMTGIIFVLFLVCLLDVAIHLETSRRMMDYILGTVITQDKNMSKFDLFSLTDSRVRRVLEDSYQDPTRLDEF